MRFLNFLIFLPLLAFANNALVYNKTTGTNTITMTWSLEEKNNQYKIQGVSKAQIIDITASIPYTLLSYSYTSQKNKDFYHLKLVNGVLSGEGEKSGEKLSSQHKIGSKAWVQDFEFGLKPFVLSKNKSLNFCVINPSNLKLHDMVATKEEDETLEIGGKTYHSIRIKVTLDGFKKMFWKGLLWFDKESGIMLKYQANEGPHTPTNTTTLATIGDIWTKSLFKEK